MPKHKLTQQQYDMLTDAQYARHREALVPNAVAEADAAVAKATARAAGDYGREWNRVFFSAMDRMARDRGLIR